MRWLLALLCLTFASLTQANAAPSLEGKVDKVLVLKSERKLLLLNKGNVLKSYRVSLGKRPTGPKLAEGDNRTPGRLLLDRLAQDQQQLQPPMHISYPNARDVAKAREKGLPAGGMIMIHGTPLDDEYPEWYFSTLDWTNGCIAMNNTDMREVWSVVKDGTLIEIRP